MNKIFFSKWNAAVGTYVACSEISRKKTRTKSTALLVTALGLALPAFVQAAPCTANTNGTFAVNNATNNLGCEIATVSPQIGNDSIWNIGFLVYSQGRNRVMTLNNNVTTLVKGSGGISVYGTSPTFTSTFGAADKAINLTISNLDANQQNTLGDNIQKSGVGVTHGGAANIGTMDVIMKNLPIGAPFSFTPLVLADRFEHYGVVSGSTNNSGEPDTFNGMQSKAIFDNLSIDMQSGRNGTSASYPLLVGIRSIQGAPSNSGNGSAGYVEITNDLKINVEATTNDALGIYVSGTKKSGVQPEVRLHNSDIKIKSTSSRANAIRLGKDFAIGEGVGQLYSTGHMKIDTTEAPNDAAIDVIWQGALLEAGGGTASTTVKAGKEVLTVSGSANSTGDFQTVTSFNNLIASTIAPAAHLVDVGTGQKDYVLNVTGGDSLLTAAPDGYLVNVAGGANTPSVTTFNFADGTMLGLTNKTAASTLNINMDTGATWNLVEKTTNPVTSTFTSVSMTAASTLNAFKPGAAAFIMQGQQVSSSASTIDLVDTEPNDLLTLTLTGGSSTYAASDGAMLKVDTCMGNDSALSDRLKVNGNVSGVTTLQVNPATLDDPLCQGALTTQDGILVVEVTGDSPADSFVLEGGTVVTGKYAYKLVQVGSNWYLQSESTVGTLTVSKSVTVPADSGLAFSGSIPFSVTCTGPEFTASGNITVTNNMGEDAVVNDVPGGSQCEVAEGTLPDAPAGYFWGAPSYVQPVGTMTAGGTQEATITNELVDTPSAIVASVTCAPTTLTDSEGQVATCTVTLSAPAPANGLPIAITPPTGNNPRYTTTCTSPLMVSAGATTASCTITAVANTVVGDGDALATLALLAGEGYTLGDPASATVTVQDDDKAAGTPTPIPTLGQWSLMLLGLGIAGLAARRRRLH